MTGNNVFITGASGMLGSSLIKNLTAPNIVASPENFDITDQKAVNQILTQIKPTIIIHTAAYTDVEGCEQDPDLAYQINSLGTQNLVNYCLDKDVLFIYISSTGVYGSIKNSAYTEFDNVSPTTVHHKSKYEAENIVSNHLSKYLILRTGWLYGGEISQPKNFVYKRFKEACDNKIIYSDDTQIGCPTYCNDLIEQIELLIKNNQYGLFNCVNEAQNISRYDYVKKIIELFDVDCDVKIAPKNMFKRVAPVSNNESAINYKLKLTGLNIMQAWDESLKNYILTIKREINA